MNSKKWFWLGFGLGMVLALGCIQLWGMYFIRALTNNAQPALLRPLAPKPFPLDSSEGLPRPWLPETVAEPTDGWQIKDMNGRPTTISSFKGKVLFLNFWSTGCVPCIREMPGISHMAASLTGEPIQFAAVTDEGPEQVASFLREHKVNVPIYLGHRPYPANVEAEGIPTTYVLNKEGVVVYQHVGASNWDDNKVRAYLRNLAQN